ncbi:MAG: alpha/beta fold hydrolase, partial [Longimicrobiales bacterium]
VRGLFRVEEDGTVPKQLMSGLAVGAMTLCIAAPASSQTTVLSHRFTSSDGVELHYLEAGAGPLLVFVPGWTMPAEIWRPQIEHFAAEYRVVAFDPRGQGRSEKANHGYYAGRRARDIGELLEHLDDEPAILVGWSLGVHEVLEYTLQTGTDQVSALVLVDHAIAADWSASPAFKSRYAEVQTNRDEWIRMFVRAIFATPQPESYLEAMTDAALATPANATAIMIGNLILMDTGDLTPAVEALDKPALFVWIEGRPDEWTEAVRRHKPDAGIVVIPDAGHALFVDQPARFNEALENFLRGITDQR